MPNRYGRATEAETQKTLFQLAGYYPELKLMFAIPNGGSRNKIEGKHLKEQGVKAGVPDIFLPIAKNGYHGLFLELKVEKNKLSKQQSEWIENLKKQGYKAVVAYGIDEAIKVLMEYIKNENRVN